MKETLVSYETAVLAKEKGFKELVSYYYHPDYGIHTHGDPEDMNAKEWRSGYYSAPTQSLLQKWLREYKEVNIEICLGEEYYFFKFGKTIDEFIEQEISFIEGVKVKFKTYEEALEMALKESLNLL